MNASTKVLILLAFLGLAVVVIVIGISVSVINILVISTIGLIVTLIVNSWTIYNNSRSQKIGAFNLMISEWERTKQAMTSILNESEITASSPMAHDIETVLSICNRIGFMVEFGMVPEEQAAMLIGGRVVQLWRKLEPLVYDYRSKANDIAWVFFEDFARTLQRSYYTVENGRLTYTHKDRLHALSQSLRRNQSNS